MLTLIIALLIGGACGYAAYAEWNWGWGVACGIMGFLLSQVVIGLILRGAIKNRQDRIQKILQEAQQKINKQLNLFQIRPPSSQKAAQQILEKIQLDAARKALEATDAFKPLYLWNLMLKKQIAAMRMQLYYQLREFKKVDECLKTALLIDSQSVAIGLARMYRNEDAGLDKFYAAKARRVRDEGAAFVASVYAWIKIRQGDETAAREALVAAKKKSDHPVLLDNLDKLLNGKVKQFSNAGFGDIWYALFLEEPKVKQQRQRQGRPY